MLALAVGGIAIATVNGTVYSPEAQVERYLEALAAGDGGTALALAGGGVDAGHGAATVLLTGEPLATGVAALGEFAVTRGDDGAADAADGAAVVTVAYTVDGTEHRTDFTVEHAGRDWLFFDRWRMAPVPLQTVRVAPEHLPPEAAAGPVTARVNGVEAALVPRDGEPGQAFAVLPPFTVDAEFSSTYLTADPARLVVDGARSSHAEGTGGDTEEVGTEGTRASEDASALTLPVELRYTDAVAEEVNRQLDAYLTGCTEQQVLHPAGCPLGYDTVNRVPPDSIRWSFPDAPEASVVPLPAEGADPTAVAPVEAEAELTLQEIDLVTGEQRRVVHPNPFTFEADLSVTPESVTFTPRLP